MIIDLKDEDIFCFSLVLICFTCGVVRRFLNSGFDENLINPTGNERNNLNESKNFRHFKTRV